MDVEGVEETRRGNRVTRSFGLKGGAWMRHANPASVWTRFATLPLLALAIWSRDWIGWWSLIPIGLSLVWVVVNPRFFHEPSSTKNWASRSVLGERTWTEGNRSSFPREFVSRVPNVAIAFQVVGLIVLVYGLIELDPIASVTGVVVVQLPKIWYLDRMVLLFEAMKSRSADYAAWDF
jgi:hypothetical protein